VGPIAAAAAGDRHGPTLEAPELLLKRTATAVVKTVNGVLGAAEPLGDLAGGETD
jgi:hypothetical protein